jgi:hypothetical protein
MIIRKESARLLGFPGNRSCDVCGVHIREAGGNQGANTVTPPFVPLARRLRLANPYSSDS